MLSKNCTESPSILFSERLIYGRDAKQMDYITK